MVYLGPDDSRPIAVPISVTNDDIAWFAQQAELAGRRIHLHTDGYPPPPPTPLQQVARMRLNELLAQARRPARYDTGWIEMEQIRG